MAYWKAIREQVLDRDNSTCQECGDKTRVMHAHHKIPRWQGGKDELGNLITLCKECHIELHRLEDQAIAKEREDYIKAFIKAKDECNQAYLDQGGDSFDMEAYGEFFRLWDWPIEPD